MTMENRFQPGDKERAQNKYLYRIIGTATHSETGELMMVYHRMPINATISTV